MTKISSDCPKKSVTSHFDKLKEKGGNNLFNIFWINLNIFWQMDCIQREFHIGIGYSSRSTWQSFCFVWDFNQHCDHLFVWIQAWHLSSVSGKGLFLHVVTWKACHGSRFKILSGRSSLTAECHPEWRFIDLQRSSRMREASITWTRCTVAGQGQPEQ